MIQYRPSAEEALAAMAAGTPVIALKAPHSAADCLVTHGTNGLLVVNADEMAVALGSLLADEALRNRLSAAGRETARKYDLDGSVIPAVEKYYREVVGG